MIFDYKRSGGRGFRKQIYPSLENMRAMSPKKWPSTKALTATRAVAQILLISKVFGLAQLRLQKLELCYERVEQRKKQKESLY